MAANNLLITGLVGVGKTTVVKNTLAELTGSGIRASGFYTEEQRDLLGRRVGFRLVPLSGGKGYVLAHAGLISQHRVGRYGVDVEILNYVVDTTLAASPEIALYAIDEIGKMECFSKRFVRAVERLLAADDVAVLATVAKKGSGLIDAVKQRDDVLLVEVTPGNRDGLPGELAARLAGSITRRNS